MKTKKLSLANIQSKMSRAEMKDINGGTMPVGDVCKGIITCPKEHEGEKCLGDQSSCTCKRTSDGDYMCM